MSTADTDAISIFPRVGVLALQGDFARHMLALERSGAESIEVRDLVTLESCSALIIPGGESSTMSWLLDRFALREPLINFIKGKPVWGTCAGLILLASEIVDSAESAGVKVEPFGLLDISIARNAYGRQINSFVDEIRVSDASNGNGEATEFTIPGSFIRAPRITRIGESVEVLASVNGDPVLVRRESMLGSTFHSELHDDPALTRYFVDTMMRPSLANESQASESETEKDVA